MTGTVAEAPDHQYENNYFRYEGKKATGNLLDSNTEIVSMCSVSINQSAVVIVVGKASLVFQFAFSPPTLFRMLRLHANTHTHTTFLSLLHLNHASGIFSSLAKID